MALCEFGKLALKKAEEKAKTVSASGEATRVLVKCTNPLDCPVYFSAHAENGVVKSGGIDSGYPCKKTGGRPN